MQRLIKVKQANMFLLSDMPLADYSLIHSKKWLLKCKRYSTLNLWPCLWKKTPVNLLHLISANYLLFLFLKTRYCQYLIARRAVYIESDLHKASKLYQTFTGTHQQHPRAWPKPKAMGSRASEWVELFFGSVHWVFVQVSALGKTQGEQGNG